MTDRMTSAPPDAGTDRLRLGDVLDATSAMPWLEPAGADLAALRAMPIHKLAISSGAVEPGDLFVALPGTRTHGARFVPDAYARGALAALTPEAPALSAEQRAARLDAIPSPAPFAALVVPDPLLALQRAAEAWRERHAAVIAVGVTGSVGKTSTREAIAGVLSTALPVLVSEKSYNNEIGLPLTLLRLTGEHRAAVLEMGTYGPGEIADLAALARPAIGVVTMVAAVHLERMGTLDNIARAKAELVEALPPDGAAVLNGDDPRVYAMAARTQAHAVTFGLGEGNDWRAVEIEDHGLDGFAFTLVHGAARARVRTPVVGRHFIHALLAAAAVGAQFDITFNAIVDALGNVRIGERQRLLHGPRDLLVIDDAWNASLPSMVAALDVLAATGRRRVAVLGEMRELGAEHDAAHRAVGRHARETADVLVAVGAGGALLAAAAHAAGMPDAAIVRVHDAAAAREALDGLIRPGDAVLIKGSRALGLDALAPWLLERA